MKHKNSLLYMCIAYKNAYGIAEINLYRCYDAKERLYSSSIAFLDCI